MANELTWKQAIKKILESSPGGLHYEEITEKIISEGLRTSLGATPAATVNAQISSSIKNEGAASPYIRVSKGIFAWKPTNYVAPVATLNLSPSVLGLEEADDTEEQYEIVTSFGMYWRKDMVTWKQKPKLLGQQPKATTAVDFFQQVGIYLLHDGREVVYVGRTTDRPLGLRLYEHTKDRLSFRWDRFSWFGLLPIGEEGQIGVLPATHIAAKLIPALEAVLIEAMEPRLNRRRGDDLSRAEFIQVVDPEIEKNRVKAALGAALEKL